MGVVIRRWVWLETIGVVSGCFLHITYIFLLHLYLFFFAAASLLLFSFCYYIYRMERKCSTGVNVHSSGLYPCTFTQSTFGGGLE